MKKLRLYDHNDVLLNEFDVYVEGENFSWRSDKPTAYWLGSIVLEDAVDVPVIPEEVEPKPEPKTVAEIWGQRVRAKTEFEPQLRAEVEPKEEVQEVEPETVGNQVDEHEGAAPHDTPESLEAVPEKPARGEAAKRGKRTRQPKPS